MNRYWSLWTDSKPKWKDGLWYGSFIHVSGPRFGGPSDRAFLEFCAFCALQKSRDVLHGRGHVRGGRGHVRGGRGHVRGGRVHLRYQLPGAILVILVRHEPWRLTPLIVKLCFIFRYEKIRKIFSVEGPGTRLGLHISDLSPNVLKFKGPTPLWLSATRG